MKNSITKLITQIFSLGIRENQTAFEARQIRTLNRISFFLTLINVVLLIVNIISKRYIPFYLNIAIIVTITLPALIFNYKQKYKASQFFSFFGSNTLILLYAYFGITINRIVNFEILIVGCAFLGAFIFDSGWWYISLIYSLTSFILIEFMKINYGHTTLDTIFFGKLINSFATTIFVYAIIYVYKQDFIRSELDLSKSENRLSLVLKGSDNGWWDWDLLADTLYYAPSWWNMIGYKVNELLHDSKLWWNILHPDDISHMNALYSRAIATDISNFAVEFRLKHKSGHYIPVLSKGLISRDSEGKAIRISGSNFDLTEHKQIEQRLEDLVAKITEKNDELSKQKAEIQTQSEKLSELNQVKDRLFSTIAHDIRGPFSSLLLAINAVKDGTLSSQELTEMLPDIETDANNTLGLIDSLFDWARSQLDGEQIHPINFDCVPMIEEELSMLMFRAKDKGIFLLSNLTKDSPIYADKDMIEIVVRNLISNALKFCGLGDKIIISSVIKNAFLEISVLDTGKGISKENLEKIFTNNVVSTSGSHGEKGTGLGLLLSKEFIEKNGGLIGVESELTRGSRFYFTVPIAKTENKKQQEEV